MQSYWRTKLLRTLGVLVFASVILTQQVSAQGCSDVALPPIGGMLALAPAMCSFPLAVATPEAPSSIATAGPATEFRVQGEGLWRAQAASALDTAASVDSLRCSVRPVPMPVHVQLDGRPVAFGGSTTGMSNAEWLPLADGRTAVLDISITFYTRHIHSAPQFQFVAGHEYMHALHQSLGLVRLPVDVEEGLAYWVEYSNVYPTAAGDQLSAWDQEAVPHWQELRDLAVQGAPADPDRTQLGAFTTAYVFHDLGCRGWLEALAASDGSPASIDRQLERRTGQSWADNQQRALALLASADGGLVTFGGFAAERD